MGCFNGKNSITMNNEYQIIKKIIRSSKNCHRLICFIDGGIKSFETSAKELTEVAKLFGHLNQVKLCRAVVGASLILSLLSPSIAFALPTGYEAVSGDITFNVVNDNTLQITSTTNQAIINYDTFNIGFGETVQFFTPDSTSSILNRVFGGVSTISGSLLSNGQILLVNQQGITFTDTASVNVAGMIASSLNITDQNYLNNNYSFDKNPLLSPSSVINQGDINVSDSVVLMGSGVSNSGNIFAHGGSVHLVVGETVQLQLSDSLVVDVQVTQALQAKVEALSVALSNTGTIQANDGLVELVANVRDELFTSVTNLDGIIVATSVETLDSGTIVLRSNNVYLAGDAPTELSPSGMSVSTDDLSRMSTNNLQVGDHTGTSTITINGDLDLDNFGFNVNLNSVDGIYSINNVLDKGTQAFNLNSLGTISINNTDVNHDVSFSSLQADVVDVSTFGVGSGIIIDGDVTGRDLSLYTAGTQSLISMANFSGDTLFAGTASDNSAITINGSLSATSDAFLFTCGDNSDLTIAGSATAPDLSLLTYHNNSDLTVGGAVNSETLYMGTFGNDSLLAVNGDLNATSYADIFSYGNRSTLDFNGNVNVQGYSYIWTEGQASGITFAQDFIGDIPFIETYGVGSDITFLGDILANCLWVYTDQDNSNINVAGTVDGGSLFFYTSGNDSKITLNSAVTSDYLLDIFTGGNNSDITLGQTVMSGDDIYVSSWGNNSDITFNQDATSAYSIYAETGGQASDINVNQNITGEVVYLGTYSDDSDINVLGDATGNWDFMAYTCGQNSDINIAGNVTTESLYMETWANNSNIDVAGNINAGMDTSIYTSGNNSDVTLNGSLTSSDIFMTTSGEASNINLMDSVTTDSIYLETWGTNSDVAFNSTLISTGGVQITTGGYTSQVIFEGDVSAETLNVSTSGNRSFIQALGTVNATTIDMDTLGTSSDISFSSQVIADYIYLNTMGQGSDINYNLGGLTSYIDQNMTALQGQVNIIDPLANMGSSLPSSVTANATTSSFSFSPVAFGIAVSPAVVSSSPTPSSASTGADNSTDSVVGYSVNAEFMETKVIAGSLTNASLTDIPVITDTNLNLTEFQPALGNSYGVPVDNTVIFNEGIPDLAGEGGTALDSD